MFMAGLCHVYGRALSCLWQGCAMFSVKLFTNKHPLADCDKASLSAVFFFSVGYRLFCLVHVTSLAQPVKFIFFTSK